MTTETALTIAEARAAYAELRDKALRVHPGDASYINDLWRRWDRELGLYGDLAEPVNQAGAAFLTKTIRAVPDDTVLEWMDAYPDGIVDRMAGGMFA